MSGSSGLRASFAVALLAVGPAWRVPGDGASRTGAEEGPQQASEQGSAQPSAQSSAQSSEPSSDPGSEEGQHVYEMTLEGAWTLALQRNLGLQIQELASEVARYNARSSWGTFDWSFTSRAGWSDREFENPNTLFGSSTGTRDSQTFEVDLAKVLLSGGTLSAGWSTDNSRTSGQSTQFDTQTSDILTLSLTQPLLRGFGDDVTTATQREAELEYRRQQEIQRSVRQTLLLDVSNAYWDLVAAREQLAVAASNLDLGREQARRERLRLDAGVGTEVDVLQADTQVALREERQIFFQYQVQQTMDRLKQLLFPGTREDLWETVLVPTTPLPTEAIKQAAPPWTVAVRTAIENRSELRQQRLVLDSAEVEHARTQSERLAGLDLSLSAISNGFDNQPVDAYQESFSFDFPTYSAALTYSIPLGNRTARNAERAAWANVRAARLTYDRIESDIVASVREAVRQVAYQAEAVTASEKSLELAQRQLDAEEARYEQDLSTTFQLLDFQQQLLDAQSQERRARVDYARSLVALDAAVGVLGEVTPH
jgi:outer membrane protein